MANILLENVTNCIWHAFISLQQQQQQQQPQNDHQSIGLVQKSKLKVLTANIATLFDLYGVEKGLDHYKSGNLLNFQHFLYYLRNEVFISLPKHLQPTELRNYEQKISEICWLISRKQYLPSSSTSSSHNEENVFQLFSIFCLLAEWNDVEQQVILPSSEMLLIIGELMMALGCQSKVDLENFCESINQFSLHTFLLTFATKFDVNGIDAGVRYLYEVYVEDVLKKGYLRRRGYVLPTMKEYWCVLRPNELIYYKSSAEKERCGVINLDAHNRIEPKCEYKFLLFTDERSFEFGANDHMSRLQWISALQTAVQQSGNVQSYQRVLMLKRRMQRFDRRQEMLRTKALLQVERRAREVAEGQAKELELVVREEAKRMNELELIKVKLERLLVEEVQAKRDEEIVRALQARVLAEEWEKREELERLQVEQNVLLRDEIGKRLEYERLQKSKETQLKEAEDKLKALEEERKDLDRELCEAHKKIKISENMKVLLGEKLENVTMRKEGDRVRRAHSFIPSTKEKPAIKVQQRCTNVEKSTKN